MSFYSDENHDWLQGGYLDVPAEVDWEYKDILPPLSVNASIGSAAFFKYDKDSDTTTATLIAFGWDTGYSFTGYEIFEVAQSGEVGNPVQYTIATDTMIGFASTAYRYTPNGFIKCDLLVPRRDCTYVYGYGSDLFVGAEFDQKTVNYYAVRFDPYNNMWTRTGTPQVKSVPADKMNAPIISGVYAAVGGNVFHRDGNGEWVLLGTLPKDADLSSVRLNSIGGAYLAYNLNNKNNMRIVPLYADRMADHTELEGETLDQTFGYGCGVSQLVTRARAHMVFHRLKGNCYAAQYEQRAVTGMEYDYGTGVQNIYMEYHPECARLDGGSLAFSTVSVIPSDKKMPFGRTDYLYFNGASPADFAYMDDADTNVKDYYSHFSGMLYATAEYDSQNAPVTRTDTFFRALDVAGFCIVQSRNVKREYYPGFDYSAHSYTGNTAVIETVIRNEYDPAYYVLRKSTKITTDKSGGQIIKSRSYRYAFDDVPSARSQNILSERSGSVCRDENTGTVLEAEKYVYKLNASGYLYRSSKWQWNGRGEPVYESDANWIRTEEVLAADQYCNGLTTQDAFGVCDTTIYDKNGDMVIAQIADCRRDEALYCGFEPYEELGGITLGSGDVGQAVTTGQCYSGTRSLFVRAGLTLTASVGAVRAEGILVSFAVKARSPVVIHCGSASETLDAGRIDFGRWSRVSVPLTGVSAGNAVSLDSKGDFYIDALFVTPLTARAEAVVYSGDHLNVCAKHDNTFGGTRTYYDRMQSAVANADDFGNFYGFSNTTRLDGMMETFSAQAVSAGSVYDSRSGYIDNPLFSCVSDGFLCEPQISFAVFVKVKCHNLAPAFELGKVSVKRADGRWILRDGAVAKTADDTAYGENYMLVKAGGRIRFMGEGKVLFAEDVSESGTVRLSVTACSMEDIEVFGFIPEAALSVHYSDLGGRCIQSQHMTDQGLEIKHNIYNSIGMLETETAAALIPGANFGYRETFVTGYQGNTEPVSGEVADLFPEAEGYPYTSVSYSGDERCRPVENSSFGARCRMGGGNTAVTVTAAACALPSGIRDNICIAHSVTGMDRITTTRISDGSGLVMTIEQRGEERIVTAYENNVRGQHEKVYYPNYFSGDTSAFGEITYDALGYVSSRREPDYSLVRTVYDSYGRLRFLCSDPDGNGYVYHSYDRYGRETEVGLADAAFNGQELREMADAFDRTPPGAVPARQIFYYDGTDTENTYEIGRVAKVVTYNDGGQTVSETYQYDRRGNVSVYTVNTGGHVEKILSEYDIADRVLQRQTGDPADGILAYSYDAHGHVKETWYNGEKIYGTEYEPNGKLTAELLGTMKRTYDYNTAHALAAITDDFVTQKLEYDDGHFYSGRITGITTCIRGADAAFSQEYRRAVSYDALGRVHSVTDTGEAPGSGEIFPALAYDHNNNPMNGLAGETLEYQQGSNRLLRADDVVYSYSSSGAVCGAGSVSMEYDRVFGNVAKLRLQDAEIGYAYGADGICMHNEGNRKAYCVSAGGKTILERDEAGTLRLYVYGANGVIAEIVNGKIYWLLKDYQGSVLAVCDGGKVCMAYRYAVGGAVVHSYTDQTAEGLTAFGFIGARMIADRGALPVYRFDHRFYDAKTGRFLSVDPMVQFVNPYVYGNADWINYVDPDGAWSWGIFGAILGGIAAIVGGFALTVISGGLAAPALALSLGLVGAGLVDAGAGSAIYGITTAVKGGDFDVKDWGVTVGCGALFGALTAGAGALIPGTCLVGIGCSAAVSTFITDAGIGVVTGILDGYVTNGFLNLAHGCDFNANAGTAIWQGAVCGAVVGAFTGLASGFRSNVARHIGSNQNKYSIGIGTELHSGKFHHSMLGMYEGENLIEARDVWPARGRRTLVQSRLTELGDNSPQLRLSRLSVTDETYNAISAKLPAEGVTNARFSVYTNSCTGNVVKWIAEGGICPPFWVRWPSALRFWAYLASI